MDKMAMREEMRRRRESLDVHETQMRSPAVTANLMGLPEWKTAHAIALYAAVGGEVDLTDLTEFALGRGDAVYFPRLDTNGMHFCQIASLSDLSPGRFGISAPDPSSPAVDPGKLDLMLVPGLAFDALGTRLGRGQGYYDMVLVHTGAIKVGVGWDFQVVETVPSSEHDARVDLVVTEQRILRRNR